MDKRSTLPDILASDTVKRTEDYAVKIFKYIIDYSKSDYFNKRNDRFSRNRKYLDGQQDIKDYADFFDITLANNEGIGKYEVAGNNLGRHYLRLMDKFLNDDITIKVESSDIHSNKRKSKILAKYRFNLEMQDMIEKFKQQGVDISEKVDKNFESSAELDLWAASENNIMEEIILESEIQDNFNDEHFNTESERRILEHLFVCGVSHTETYYDSNNMIKHRVILPDRKIDPICERNDMYDRLWSGEVMEMTISDARILFGDDVKEEELYKLAANNDNPAFSLYPKWDEKWNTSAFVPYNDYKIKVLKAYIKLIKDDSVVKAISDKGNVFLRKLENKGKIKNAVISDIITDKKYELWSGYYIERINKVFKWGKVKNMIKKNGSIEDVQIPYSSYMYENVLGSNVSVVETMIPYIRLIDILWGIYHNVISGISPDKYQINIDALNNVLVDGYADSPTVDEDGNIQSQRTSHQKLIELFFKKGLLFARDLSTSSGESLANLGTTSNKPVVFLGSGVSDSPQRIMQMIEIAEQQMKKSVGFNDWTDNSSVSDRANQLTIQNQVNVTNNATKFLEDSIYSIVKQVAEKTGIMIWDSIVFDGYYAKKIGKSNATLIKEENEKPYEFDFNINIEKGLTPLEMQRREQNINTALSAGLINPVQAESIRGYKNFKLAMQKLELELARERKDKYEQEVRVVTEQAKEQAEKDKALIDQKNVDNQFQLQKQREEFAQNMLLEAFKSGKAVNDLDDAYKVLVMPYINDIQLQEAAKQQMQAEQMQQPMAMQQ